MSGDIEWKQDFNVGIEEIDLQHHYFVSLINRLSHELGDTEDLAYQSRLLTELIQYAQFHFISEENIMYRLGYPELDDHHKLHRDLINTLHVKTGLLRESMVSAAEVIAFLKEWFIGHTLGEDKKLTPYLVAKD